MTCQSRRFTDDSWGEEVTLSSCTDRCHVPRFKTCHGVYHLVGWRNTSYFSNFTWTHIEKFSTQLCTAGLQGAGKNLVFILYSCVYWCLLMSIGLNLVRSVPSTRSLDLRMKHLTWWLGHGFQLEALANINIHLLPTSIIVSSCFIMIISWLFLVNVC